MNNRLDFFNYLNNHLETLNESEDYAFVLTYNKQQGDLICTEFGDWECMSRILSSPNNEGFIKGDPEIVKQMRNTVLNTAINIINEYPEHKETFRNFLDQNE